MAEYFPILLYFFAVLGFAAVSLLFPHIIAPRKKTVIKDMPYESGMDPHGDARKPQDVKFYLMAILFLVFDIELLYLYPWAVSAKGENGIPTELRLPVFGTMTLFLITLAIAYIVALRRGVFQWRQK